MKLRHLRIYLLKAEKEIGTLKTNFFAGYEKELNNVDSWRDTFSLNELGSSKYATPVRDNKNGVGLLEIGATMEVADGFTVNANLSENSLGDEKATAGFKFVF